MKSKWHDKVIENSHRLAITLQGKDECAVWPVTIITVLSIIGTNPRYFDSQYLFEDNGDFFIMMGIPSDE